MFSTFYMKKMIPLRAVGICSNIAFIIYAGATSVYPLLVLHLLLLPLNAYRMIQMVKLVNNVRQAAKGGYSMDFLVPFMKKEAYKKGDIVFRKGDESGKMYYLHKGVVKLIEEDVIMRDGSLIGEIGIFSPNKLRTGTVICETDAQIYTIPESNVIELYYQNPKFGFYLVQMIVKRFLKEGGKDETLILSHQPTPQ
jgi:CRP/FNR family cyclic AMP-dependent transcriptional regulator